MTNIKISIKLYSVQIYSPIIPNRLQTNNHNAIMQVIQFVYIPVQNYRTINLNGNAVHDRCLNTTNLNNWNIY